MNSTTIGARLKRGFGYSMIGQLAGYILGFIIAPIYARKLEPGEYGIIGLSSSVRSVLLMLMPMSIAGAVSYWYNLEKAEPEKLRHTMGAIAGLGILTSVGWLVLFLITGAFLQSVILPDLSLPFWPYGALIIGSAWLLSLQSIPVALLATKERQDLYAVMNVGLGVVQTIWIVVFIVLLRRGVAGQIEAMFLYTVTVVPLFLWMMFRRSPIRIDLQLWRRVALYSLPLLPHQLAVWGLNLSDRLIIGHYGHRFAEDLGLYSFGYAVAMVMQGVTSGFSSIWSPVFMEQARSNPHAQTMLGKTASWSCLILTLAASGLILFAPIAVEIMGGSRYSGSRRFIAPVVLGYFMQGVYLFPVMGLFHMNKTARLPIITIASASLNIALNLLLIPRYGVIVAAWSTAAGFTLLAILAVILGHPAYPLRYLPGPLILSAVILILSFALNGIQARYPWTFALKAIVWVTVAFLSYCLWRKRYWSATEQIGAS